MQHNCHTQKEIKKRSQGVSLLRLLFVLSDNYVSVMFFGKAQKIVDRNHGP